MPRIPTGLRELDEALDGGVPCSCISEICGSPTSGATTLALRLVASAQAAGLVVVVVDVSHGLGARYAMERGVDVESLLLVRPPEAATMLEIAGDLVLSQAVDLIVVVAGPEQPELPPGSWQKLAVRVANSRVAVVLTSPESSKVSTDKSYVAVRLQLERLQWLWEGPTLRGWESQVRLVKNKLGAAEDSMRFAVQLPDPDL